MLGVSDATITHIETGKRRVTPANAIAWEGVTGISRAELCPDIFGCVPGAKKSDPFLPETRPFGSDIPSSSAA